MSSSEHSKDFAALHDIVQKLRGPEGCPWDQKQSPKSIVKYLLEEAQELAEAMSKGDTRHVCEEAGDLFFILILVVQMYEENHDFTSHDVLAGISRKMIRRHPHVFAGTKTGSDCELKQQWEEIKKAEKKKS